MTGGNAEVTLEVLDKTMRGRPFKVQIKAVVGESECKINKVYLKVRGVEHVKVPNVEVAEKKGDVIESRRKTIQHQENTYELDQDIAPETLLQAGQTYTWETEVDLPKEVIPTFTGKNARHEWRLMAGLDMRGNDPDSGWVDIHIE
jgi:hypothetical protein